MNTIVTVKEGALEGAFSDDKQSVIFKGVPYADTPRLDSCLRSHPFR